MKKLDRVFLILLLICLFSGLAQAEDAADILGKPFPSFTITSIDGQTVSLSDLLSEKEVVAVNIFASWCPPCESEFPDMEAVYERYSDVLEIVSLSGDPDDSNEILTEYRDSHRLSFIIGSETGSGIFDAVSVTGFPNTFIVDRFGNVGFVQDGAFHTEAEFEQAVKAFAGDDYTETIVRNDLPEPGIDVELPDEADLSAAVSIDLSDLAFGIGEGDYPFIPQETEERTAVYASNTGLENTVSSMETTIDANAGDVLVFDVICHTRLVADTLFIKIDDEIVKVFQGDHDWMTWAVEVPQGEHVLRFEYERFSEGVYEGEVVGIDNVVLLSGDIADDALFSLPEQPYSDEMQMGVISEYLKAGVYLWDGDDIGYWFYLIDENEVAIQLLATKDMDSDAAVIENVVTGDAYTLSECLNWEETDYTLTIPYDHSSQYPYLMLAYIEDAFDDETDIRYLVLSHTEEGLKALADEYLSYGYDLTIQVTEDNTRYSRMSVTPARTARRIAKTSASAGNTATYTVHVVDQDGNPVPGVMVNFCTDTTCSPNKADENGQILFKGAPAAYHLQVLTPAGYSFDKLFEMYTESRSSEITIRVTRD